MNEIDEDIFKDWFVFLPQLIIERQLYLLGSIRFEIRSRERGSHNCPHLHVSNKSSSMVIDISTSQIIESTGIIKSSKVKDIKDWVDNNREYLMNVWNECTDSDIKFDLNKFNESGVIKYSVDIKNSY